MPQRTRSLFESYFAARWCLLLALRSLARTHVDQRQRAAGSNDVNSRAEGQAGTTPHEVRELFLQRVVDRKKLRIGACLSLCKQRYMNRDTLIPARRRQGFTPEI